MKAASLDLTKDVSSFSVESIPVILRTTENFSDISSEIVALNVTAFGGVNLTTKPGTLELLSELLLKGTYSFSKEQIDHLLTKTGASLRIDAGLDAMSLQLKCLKKHLPELLPLISEMLRVPLFDQKEIDLSKQQLITELQGELQHPDSLLPLKMHQIFFKNHPYYNRPNGYLDTVPGIQREDLSASFFKAFNKANLLFIFVGDLKKSEVEKIMSGYFASIQSGRRTPEISDEIQNLTGVHFEKFNAPTTYFLAKFKAPSLFSEDYPALTIALQILDNRLFDEVRTKRSLTYAVHADLGNSRVNSGYIYVTSTKLQETVDIIFQEVKKLQVDAVGADVLKLQTNKYLSSWYLGRETRNSQAAIFSLYEVFGIGWENSNSFIQRLERVTPVDIQRVMNTYLKDMSIVVMGSQPVDLQPVLSRLGFMPTDPASLKKSEPESSGAAASPDANPKQ